MGIYLNLMFKRGVVLHIVQDGILCNSRDGFVNPIINSETKQKFFASQSAYFEQGTTPAHFFKLNPREHFDVMVERPSMLFI